MAASTQPSPVRNGPAAAALLSAGFGAFALSVVAILADRVPGIGRFMVWYRPTGPLSGVTTTAMILWLADWWILRRRWRGRDVQLGRVGALAFTLLVLGFLLTFPPLADLF